MKRSTRTLPALAWGIAVVAVAGAIVAVAWASGSLGHAFRNPTCRTLGISCPHGRVGSAAAPPRVEPSVPPTPTPSPTTTPATTPETSPGAPAGGTGAAPTTPAPAAASSRYPSAALVGTDTRGTTPAIRAPRTTTPGATSSGAGSSGAGSSGAGSSGAGSPEAVGSSRTQGPPHPPLGRVVAMLRDQTNARVRTPATRGELHATLRVDGTHAVGVPGDSQTEGPHGASFGRPPPARPNLPLPDPATPPSGPPPLPTPPSSPPRGRGGDGTASPHFLPVVPAGQEPVRPSDAPPAPGACSAPGSPGDAPPHGARPLPGGLQHREGRPPD